MRVQTWGVGLNHSVADGCPGIPYKMLDSNGSRTLCSVVNINRIWIWPPSQDAIVGNEG